jgi:hypothetical protein
MEIVRVGNQIHFVGQLPYGFLLPFVPLMAVAANPLVGPSSLRDIVDPQFHQNNFPAEIFIKSDLGIKLDKGRKRENVGSRPQF